MLPSSMTPMSSVVAGSQAFVRRALELIQQFGGALRPNTVNMLNTLNSRKAMQRQYAFARIGVLTCTEIIEDFNSRVVQLADEIYQAQTGRDMEGAIKAAYILDHMSAIEVLLQLLLSTYSLSFIPLGKLVDELHACYSIMARGFDNPSLSPDPNGIRSTNPVLEEQLKELQSDMYLAWAEKALTCSPSETEFWLSKVCVHAGTR